jgi:hypothetical protein
MRCLTVRVALSAHDQDRLVRPVRHVAGDAAGHQAAESGMAMRSDDDEACAFFIGSVDDGLPGGSSLDCHGAGAESGCVGQLDSTRGCLLRGLPDVIGAGGIEVSVRFGDEPDTERTPDSEDNRVTSGRQLAASLGDRVVGQVRAVVGEQDGSLMIGVAVHCVVPRMASH